MSQKVFIQRGRFLAAICTILLLFLIHGLGVTGAEADVQAIGDYVGQWGSTGVGAGQFQVPRDIAVDSTGRFYVTDSENNRVQVFETNGLYLSEWNGSSSGSAFNNPRGIVMDADDNLYVADTGNDRVVKFDTSGNYLGQFGSNGSGNGEFDRPFGLAIDSEGNIYVADRENNRIQKFDSDGNYLLQWGGLPLSGFDGEFNRPQYLAIDEDDNVYVTDNFNYRVQKFDSSGNFLLKWGTIGTGVGQFDQMGGIALGPAGNVYVSDFFNDRVHYFDQNGNYIDTFGGTGSGNGQMSRPSGVEIGRDGKIYVAETVNNRIQIFDSGCPAARLYVDVNDETMWHNTHGTYRLQDALDLARQCDNVEEIWVAVGVYYPDVGANQTVGDRLAAFELVNGVAIYGGFGGWESELSERLDSTVFGSSVLSGDIDQNDVSESDFTWYAANIVGTNSSSVLLANNTDETAVLDNFVITAGDSNTSGGGMYMDTGGPTLTNLLFIGNTANFGGAITAVDSTLTLTDVSFFGNVAEQVGGGLDIYNSTVILDSVFFEENVAYNNGGAIRGAISDYQITNSTFKNNWALDGGGAIYDASSIVAVANSAFQGNTADWGGGIYVNGSRMSITGSEVSANTALTGVGGGLYATSGDVTIENSTISGNQSGWNGGGIGTGSPNTISILNSTITNNTADYDDTGNGDGGGISAFDTTTITMVNTIVANNIDQRGEAPDCAEISSTVGAGVISNGHNLIGDMTGCPLSTQASDVLDTDPQLSPLADNGGDTWTHALASTSPAVDAGDNASCLPTDQRGINRPSGTACDIGAYEAVALYSLTVNTAGAGSGTVTSTPDGIDCGLTCMVEVAEGTVITLTATAEKGSIFTGWSGACSGTSICTVTINEATQVTATFELEPAPQYTLMVSLAGTGNGEVTSTPAGIACGSMCAADFAENTEVTLTATADEGAIFAGWSGVCSGTGSCTVTMDQAQSVTATFNSGVTDSYRIYLPMTTK